MGSDAVSKTRRYGRLCGFIAVFGVFCILSFVLYAKHADQAYESAHSLRGSDANDSFDEVQFIHPVVAVWPTVVSSYSKEHIQFDNLLSIIKRWNPDVVEPPAVFTETLQHFNYSCPAERAVAAQFLEAEMPFKLYGVPEFDAISKKWTDNYLIRNLGSTGRVEKAETNHFMFWNGGSKGVGRDYKAPTDLIAMTFKTFLKIAHDADRDKLSSEAEHFYYTTGISKNSQDSFIAKDLKLFSTRENNFFIRNVKKNKGIQCRFGMRGVSAAAHYDGGRNMVALIRGQRRYIITPPNTCDKLGVITDKRHPSYRHSVLDWSSVPQAEASRFAEVNAIDTIMNPGEVLYIPSYWFHYIVSMGYSAQCNSRHGSPPDEFGKHDINKCFNKHH